MTGTRVDVGGFQLFLNCTGQALQGSFLSGATDSSRQWDKGQLEVAHATRVCSYDRAGFGWSDPSSMPRSARQMATELHTGLVKAGISPPYVMVGHSFGGLVTQIFSGLYPGEVTGVVLEDSVHPEEVAKFPNHFPGSPALARLLRLTAPLGLPRFFGWCNATGACPDCVKYTGTVLAEYDEYAESHSQAAESMTTLGAKPLAVLAHDPAVGLNGQRDDPFEGAEQHAAGLGKAVDELLVDRRQRHQSRDPERATAVSYQRDTRGWCRRPGLRPPPTVESIRKQRHPRDIALISQTSLVPLRLSDQAWEVTKPAGVCLLLRASPAWYS